MTSTLGTPAIGSAPPESTRTRILLIDDEQRILEFVSRGLQAEGYVVDVAADGGAGLRAALDQDHDLVILDLLLPDRGGHDVLRHLVRQRPAQPVIVLSALSDTTSKVTALELGAEDYLAKPFSLRDARARPTLLAVGGLTLDLISRQARNESGRVQLAEREFLLLRELMTRAGDTLGKDWLLAAVWGYRFDPGSNVVDVYVRRLRAKLGGDVIKTVRGEGYRIDAA